MFSSITTPFLLPRHPALALLRHHTSVLPIHLFHVPQAYSLLQLALSMDHSIPALHLLHHHVLRSLQPPDSIVHLPLQIPQKSVPLGRSLRHLLILV